MTAADKMMIVLVMFVILALIVAGIYGAFTIGPIAVGAGTTILGDIRTGMQQGQAPSGLINATNTSTNMVSGILGHIELMVYLCILGLFIGYLIVAYNVKTYPWLSFIWAFLMVILVVLSMFLSNAYAEAKALGETSEFYASWGSGHFIMDKLPFIVAFFGMLSAVLLFILMQRSPEEEQNLGGGAYL